MRARSQVSGLMQLDDATEARFPRKISGEAREKLFEDRGMERALEMNAGAVRVRPGHLGRERLDSGKARDDVIVDVDEFDQLDLAAAGGNVLERDLEAEAAHAAHADLGADMNAPAAAAAVRPVRPAPAGEACAGGRAAVRHRRAVWKIDEQARRGARAGPGAEAEPLEALRDDVLVQMH